MTRLASEYAQALFSLAKKENAVRETFEELSDAQTIIWQNEETLKVLVSPAVPAKQKVDAITGTFSGKMSLLCVQFLAVLCKNGHMRMLPDVLLAYEQLLLGWEGVLIASVTSASAMSQEEETRLRTILEQKTGQTVRLSVSEDPSLLGGFSVRIGDQIWDGTVLHKLKTLKEVMKNGA